VTPGLILIGTAGGVLLTIIGLALWDSWRHIPGAPRALWILRWTTTIILLMGALLAWQEGDSQSLNPVPRLMLMAALATGPGLHPHSSSLSSALQVLPALALTEISLLWSAQPSDLSGVSGAEFGNGIHSAIEWTTVLCGGLGARTLGQVLSQLVAWISSTERELGSWSDEEEGESESVSTEQDSDPRENDSPVVPDSSSTTTYALLTLLISAMTLVNLWQRGTLWTGTTDGTRLVGAWLIWSAAWLISRSPSWLQTVLITGAALLLTLTALGI